MAIKSLRVLCQVDLPSGIIRLWDGSGGPFLDEGGNIWRACVLTEDALDTIEMAINAEAFTLSLVLSGIDKATSDAVWKDYQDGTIKGSRLRIFIQDCDEYDQPVGTPDVKFTGKIDNLIFGDQASDTGIRSTITVEVTNRFTLRTLTNGAVLSDVDQKARSKILNPSAVLDRFCERVILMLSKTIRWPNW